ncbi:hypothetical protein D3C75_754680 [compost metagenome]
MDAGPAATVHRCAHHNFARLYALIQHRLHAAVCGDAVRFPGWRIQRSLVAKVGVAPGAVEVIAHQEDVIHVLLRRVVIDVSDFGLTRANR